MTKLKEMKVEEFVRRLKDLIENNKDSKFAFFIGAGCSVSSGIPDASILVKIWLPRLKKIKTGDESHSEDWAKEIYPDYDKDKAFLFYGRIIEDLFLTPEQRQREVERLTERKDPGFGYSVLVQLITHEKYGHHCNSILTVNFDDLIADAIYLYTRKKPLVITHESLAGFIKITRMSPLIIKLHGDARLEPKNTEQETKELAENVKKILRNFLPEMGLIFIGYGGHDKSIVEILNSLPVKSLPWGIYWISDHIPESPLGEWLKQRNTFYVKHKDFDELMLLIFNEFNLKHMDKEIKKRCNKLCKTYRDTFEKLKKNIESRPEIEKDVLSKVLKSAIEEVKTGWEIVLKVDKYEKSDPKKADLIYQEGLKKFPNSIDLFNYYADFLANFLKDYDKAEVYFKKALEIDPINIDSLYWYACFLWRKRKDYDKAEVYFKKALEIDPGDPYIIGDYANLLVDIKEYDKAEKYYKEALEIDPIFIGNLQMYAYFLREVRKDYDKAEEYFKEALAINPKDVESLRLYTNFLIDIRKDYDKAEEYFKRALAIEPNNTYIHQGFAKFLIYVRKDYDKAEEYFKKALAIEPKDTYSLNSYGFFLMNIRKDYDKAEEYFKRALAIEPKDTYSLNSFGVFLMNIRKDYDKAEVYFKKALDINPDDTWSLSNYGIIFLDAQKKYSQADFFLKRALEKDSDDIIALSNYAGLLLARGDKGGWDLLEKAISLYEGDPYYKEWMLVCLFFIYAHSDSAKLRNESLCKIKALLKEGIRFIGWNFSDNVKQAIEDGHPFPRFLTQLSKVIAEEACIEELDKFDIWRENQS